MTNPLDIPVPFDKLTRPLELEFYCRHGRYHVFNGLELVWTFPQDASGEIAAVDLIERLYALD